MFISPAPVAASTTSNPGDTSGTPSTISQDGSDFTTQAALPGVFARQTNNIVNTNTYYDIIFNTATTAAIKEIRVTFPAGTDVSIARLVEAEGIGEGAVGPGSIAGQTVTYLVKGAEVTTIPAGTQIRLELANIVNPSSPGNGFTVTVETRGTTNNIIDGPTQSFAYPIKQIGTGQIADNAVTTPKIADNAILPQVVERDGASVSVNSNGFASGQAFCMSGEEPVGGGVLVFTGGQGFLTITNEILQDTGYITEMFNNHSTTAFGFTPRAHCMLPFP